MAYKVHNFKRFIIPNSIIYQYRRYIITNIADHLKIRNFSILTCNNYIRVIILGGHHPNNINKDLYCFPHHFTTQKLSSRIIKELESFISTYYFDSATYHAHDYMQYHKDLTWKIPKEVFNVYNHLNIDPLQLRHTGKNINDNYDHFHLIQSDKILYPNRLILKNKKSKIEVKDNLKIQGYIIRTLNDKIYDILLGTKYHPHITNNLFKFSNTFKNKKVNRNTVNKLEKDFKTYNLDFAQNINWNILNDNIK